MTRLDMKLLADMLRKKRATSSRNCALADSMTAT